MCRFSAYHGPPIRLDEMLYKPEHSLIHQSVHSREREEPLNGDGWGVGWYAPEVEDKPALYRTVRPAWSDDNMRHVSPVIETPIYFAHVRAASPGLAVQRLNCHPFMGGLHRHKETEELSEVELGRRRLMFMHNGRVGAYQRVMRQLRRELSDELYFTIRGTTDSEHAFAVVQQALGDKAIDPSATDLAQAVRDGIAYLEDLKHSVGGEEMPTRANFCLTDGESIVATRYASPDDEPALSLYVGQAGEFYTDTEEDAIAARRPDEEGAVLVSSERLFADDRVWERVPRNHYVMVEPDGNVVVEPLDIAS